MEMFCFQCQEAAKGTGCTVKGVCGKDDQVANLQDLLVWITKGISIYTTAAREIKVEWEDANRFVFDALFMTITNANFDKTKIEEKIREGIALRKEIINRFEAEGGTITGKLHESMSWNAKTIEEYYSKSLQIGGTLHGKS